MKKVYIILFTLLLSFSAFSQEEKNTDTLWNNFSKNIIEKVDVEVYPNPCTLNKVTFKSNQMKISSIKVYNINGVKVIDEKIDFPQHTYKLSVSDLPNGIYLVHLSSLDKKRVIKKLVLSK